MLIESAFSILPEAVAGLGFQKVLREANAVGTFSFALLNVLHTKNIVDPLQRIQLEKPYYTQSAPLPPAGKNRHCDIFLDYGGSKIGSKDLADYGWRYRNYVEAKFLKSYKQTPSGQDTNAMKLSAEVIADFIRLVALVPEPEILSGRTSPKTSSARYFLLLSDHSPEIFFLQYLKALGDFFKSPSPTSLIDLDLTTGKPTKRLSEKIGKDFRLLKLELLKLSIFAHYPLSGVSGGNKCWMLLTRIDAAKITYTPNSTTSHTFEIKIDRNLKEENTGDYKIIRDFIATNIN